MVDLAASGQLRSIIADRQPLAEVNAALDRTPTRARCIGRIVLDPTGSATAPLAHCWRASGASWLSPPRGTPPLPSGNGGVREGLAIR